MAPSIRGTASSAKEKKVTSSSSTLKKTPKPSSTTSTDTSKSVPNCLRSTKSSSLDLNKQPKKTSSGTSVLKPSYTRKNSDRPSPASPAQRAIRGTPSGAFAGARDLKAQRSSSFSNRSTVSSTPRPASERLCSKAPSLKDRKVDPNLIKSRNLNKSTLSATTAPRKKKGPKSVTSESSVNCHNRHSVDHLILEDDDLVNLDSLESLPEISEMPNSNEELGDPTYVEVEKSMVDQVLQETKKADPQPIIEGAGKQADESISNQQDGTEEKVLKVNSTDPIVEEVKEQIQTKARKEEGDPTEVKDEGRAVNSPKISHSSSIGKKEKQDYNNVIEETATKLMGGKRNKVLALAGAFETVISLQDTNRS